MKDERKTEIRVGIISITGLIIFLFILVWAKDISFTSTDREILVRFPEVAGLEAGDYVTVNGVRKGNVKEIVVQGETVLVRISIDKQVELKQDAEIAVMMLDLMGGKKIEIKPGKSSMIMDYSKVQRGDFFADIPSVMSLLGSVQDDLLSSIKDLRITLSSMNEYLTDNSLKSDVRNSMKNLNQILVRMNTLVDENQKNFDEIAKNTKELTGNANRFFNDNSDDFSKTLLSFKSILNKADSLMNVVNTIALETASKKNNLGKILYDEDLFLKLQKTLDQINELSGIINQQLKSEGLKVKADVDLF